MYRKKRLCLQGANTCMEHCFAPAKRVSGETAVLFIFFISIRGGNSKQIGFQLQSLPLEWRRKNVANERSLTLKGMRLDTWAN